MTTSLTTIVVYGGGLAGNLVSLALARTLGDTHRLLQILPDETPIADMAYGQVSAPDCYNFLRMVGLDEPTLLLGSATSFSFGTHYRNWLGGRNWMQCHHSPLPVLSGIPMRHHLVRAGETLEPYLVSAQAALAGRFAHPPADLAIALSRAEYAYQFAPTEWAELLETQMTDARIERRRSSLASLAVTDHTIKSLRLSDGTEVTGDLFIDASGPDRTLINACGPAFLEERRIALRESFAQASQLGAACRIVESDDLGWTSTTTLQSGTHTLEVRAADATGGADTDIEIALGMLEESWRGNCLAVGHAAGVIEPLTPAPLLILQRDIERLLELIPLSTEMEVERKEFNRRFRQDSHHAALFNGAILTVDGAPETPYWVAANQAFADCADLARKRAQFENRGLLTSFDLEPFNDEDWTILHLGLGRRPRQYDRQLHRVSEASSSRELATIRQSIEQLVPRIPPHQTYMSKLKQYLEKQKHG